MRKQYIEVPLSIKCSPLRKFCQVLFGMLLMPGCLMVAWILGAPGIKTHLQSAVIGLRLFLLGRISPLKAYQLIGIPLDSTRYFECHEAFHHIAGKPFTKYLDISSPRLIPLILLMQNTMANADILNPDVRDTEETKHLANALKIMHRCKFVNQTIATAPYAPETFDLITCISVLEHIPKDKKAVERMWSLLRRGGRLILTVPCMAELLEQYISHNQYGVLSPETDGYTFWQRYYDEARLQSVIFNITGMPAKIIIYGERSKGLFYRNASMKRLLGPLYPFWRESYMMAKEYRYFEGISQLPGEGVVMLELVKP
jgi:predicted SAM-dependent methyltransferase